MATLVSGSEDASGESAGCGRIHGWLRLVGSCLAAVGGFLIDCGGWLVRSWVVVVGGTCSRLMRFLAGLGLFRPVIVSW